MNVSTNSQVAGDLMRHNAHVTLRNVHVVDFNDLPSSKEPQPEVEHMVPTGSLSLETQMGRASSVQFNGISSRKRARLFTCDRSYSGWMMTLRKDEQWNGHQDFIRYKWIYHQAQTRGFKNVHSGYDFALLSFYFHHIDVNWQYSIVS